MPHPALAASSDASAPSLPPLSPSDSRLLSRYFELKQDFTALAAESRCGPLEILLWLGRPDVAAYVDAHRRHADARRRLSALDALTGLLDKTTNPVELRRIATTILRAINPQRSAPKPAATAIQLIPASAPTPHPTPDPAPSAEPAAPTFTPPPAPNPQSAIPNPQSPPSLHAALAHYKLPTELADLDPDLAAGIIADLSGETDRLEDAALDAELDEDLDEEADTG